MNLRGMSGQDDKGQFPAIASGVPDSHRGYVDRTMLSRPCASSHLNPLGRSLIPQTAAMAMVPMVIRSRSILALGDKCGSTAHDFRPSLSYLDATYDPGTRAAPRMLTHQVDPTLASTTSFNYEIPAGGRQVPSTISHCSPYQYGGQNGGSQHQHIPGRYPFVDTADKILPSASPSTYSAGIGTMRSNGNGQIYNEARKTRSRRRRSKRDEFDGPRQFIPRPPTTAIAAQERELPHLPTNLHIHEQDYILGKLQGRLSECAFDFVAKYRFPIPLAQDMPPVERPRDREWVEWVYLLRSLANKRRIPARFLYSGQIKQFITILESSVVKEDAAGHQSLPPKDDRNILQLISAGIQVAKILKDAVAMDYLDQLYTSTERRIQGRASSLFRI